MRAITVSSCNLNQWALDFSGNKQRILEAVRKAKKDGSSLIITPELSICGYSCLDAFLEKDTTLHSWEVLRDLIEHDDCQDILLDVGMPVLHLSCLFNCRVLVRNRKILYIRPKMSLANDGLFREMRYFTPWQERGKWVYYQLPQALREFADQSRVRFGDCVIEANDTKIGTEMCEELFTSDSPSTHLALSGVEIILNSSASHWQIRKLSDRLDLIQGSSKRNGSLYLYANQQGCDGEGREYFDGCALIVLNGKVVAQASQFSLNDVEVISATVDLDEIWDKWYPPARRMQASLEPVYEPILLDVNMTTGGDALPGRQLSPTKQAMIVEPEEEIGLAGGCWIWDYLRRSSQAGAFLPLSGGIDSCATAVIFFSTARLIFAAVHDGNEQVIADLRRICGEPEGSNWIPSEPQAICNRIFHTCYMGTQNSSSETRSRAKQLANDIGSYHLDLNMDLVVRSFTTLFTTLFGRTLKFKTEGGTNQEGLALQNIQSRSRMVLAYLLASTLTIVRSRSGGGNLLVLGSANVDECLRGYLTKYDCSSADINPIGGISKQDLSRFLNFARTEYKLPILDLFIEATPTAELEPISEKYTQSDEQDMGCTYEELGVFGRLRKVEKLGPFSMWQKMCQLWPDKTPQQVYQRVRFLWTYFGINRHKQEILTPSLHAETYSPDSNRYDLLPFLRPPLTWAYSKIEKAVAQVESRDNSLGKANT